MHNNHLNHLLQEASFLQYLLRGIGSGWNDASTWVVNKELQLLFFNDYYEEAILQIYKTHPEIGKYPNDYIPSDVDRSKLEANYQKALSGEIHQSIETFGENQNRQFKTVYRPFYGGSGELLGVTVVSHEITEQMRVQKALEKSEFFFRESQKAALIGSYQSEFYPEDHWVTSEVCDIIFGMDENYDKTVQGWTNLLHPDFKDEMIRYVTEDVIGKGEPFNKEYKIIRQTDGESRWVWGLGDTIQDETGRTTGLIGTIQDITDRKIADEKIRSLQSYLSSIIENMPSILISIDSNLTVQQWNQKASEVYGISEKSAIGENIIALIPELNTITDEIERVRKGLKTLSINRSFTRENVTLHVSISLFPIQTADEVTIVLRLDDVTKEVELQQRLNQSQKMDAIGQLAGGIAHDFNNILAGILGVSEILLTSESNISQENRELVEMIQRSSKRASELTAKLLAFSRKTNENYNVFDIHSCIRDIVVLLERTIDKRIVLSVDTSAENALVYGDVSAIQNAVMNLAINAAHAMTAGGTLSIATRNVELDEAYSRVSNFKISPGDFIEIEVRDTGTGIKQENMKKIFDPFFTTKEQGKGTGLGLAAVYGTVQEHHGAINVYSELGSGTVFHLYIPVSKTKYTTPETKPVSIESHTGTILLIDDEEIIRATGKYQLEKMGFTVLLAENGKEGVEIFRKNSKDIDLVISDMIMPELYGSEAFRKIKEIDKDAVVIISSGYAKDESLKSLKEEGLAGFIQKPFRIEELRKLLGKVLA